jgi:hypothetical protein
MPASADAPHAEAFKAWKDDPVTRFVLSACAKASGECKAEWDRISWAGGKCDQVSLIVLRERADAYRALAETEYEGWCETMGVEPNVE